MPIALDLLNQIKANDPTLRELNLSSKVIDDQDIKELVKALANNLTLTSLDVSRNNLGNEGVRPLRTTPP